MYAGEENHEGAGADKNRGKAERLAWGWVDGLVDYDGLVLRRPRVCVEEPPSVCTEETRGAIKIVLQLPANDADNGYIPCITRMHAGEKKGKRVHFLLFQSS